jgi:hypothetical protein
MSIRGLFFQWDRAQVERRAAETGISIYTKKTKVLKSNTKTRADLTVNGHKLEEVDSFTYLGSEIDNLGGSDKEVNIRIGKSRTAFNMMGSIWKSRDISLKTKVRLFNSNVKTILLYGSETWKTTKSLLHKLQVIINNCLRCILNIRWPEKIYNKELWDMSIRGLFFQWDRAYLLTPVAPWWCIGHWRQSSTLFCFVRYVPDLAIYNPLSPYQH